MKTSPQSNIPPLFRSTLHLKLLNIIFFSQFIGLLIIGFVLYFQFENFLINRTKAQIQEQVAIDALLQGD
jgi:hypothetical protein